jgi:hypothetical protein
LYIKFISTILTDVPVFKTWIEAAELFQLSGTLGGRLLVRLRVFATSNYLSTAAHASHPPELPVLQLLRLAAKIGPDKSLALRLTSATVERFLLLVIWKAVEDLRRTLREGSLGRGIDNRRRVSVLPCH